MSSICIWRRAKRSQKTSSSSSNNGACANLRLFVTMAITYYPCCCLQPLLLLTASVSLFECANRCCSLFDVAGVGVCCDVACAKLRLFCWCCWCFLCRVQIEERYARELIKLGEKPLGKTETWLVGWLCLCDHTECFVHWLVGLMMSLTRHSMYVFVGFIC